MCVLDHVAVADRFADRQRIGRTGRVDRRVHGLLDDGRLAEARAAHAGARGAGGRLPLRQRLVDRFARAVCCVSILRHGLVRGGKYPQSEHRLHGFIGITRG